MKIKNIWRLFPLAILIGIFSYFYFKGKNNRTKFYESKINEKIIDSSDWQKKTTEYYLENGLSIDITILDNIHLKVGDSISKQAESKKYSIYRKNQFGKYEFYKNYNIND
ncbi:hypothetical protein EG349_15825 [Chryseobacterium shandongense]|uniref:Uncharacterized protein n=1 Tax=Chryseobacterium shandongense TaxID=1493872 RepID=A0AAD1DM09_9FLAO|nr:hypothetical protein [Chryseobacterium shandongense]AZA88157.1 hypothetical protein EG349_15825 [Chryseobacterium shandongense]AZA96718.1 hypothetical protein EG353_14615 [Chryseobacterium shandongense]